MSRFGLIGEHLEYSHSPVIHSKFGEYEYDICETDEAGLEALLHSDVYDGFNVTIPYKEKVMKFCDWISDEAKNIGSVNTIIKEDGKLKGYNTDYYGFKYSLDLGEVDPKGKKCLVLGSGGASKTVKAVLKDMDAGEVKVISRTGADNYDNLEKNADAKIIVNATPVGMYPNNGACPLDIKQFDDLECVVDLIYNPYRTKLILDAMSRGITAVGGMDMLVAQAKATSEIFQGVEIDDDEIADVADAVKRETLNKILIGMPGAGKTFLGRKMAEKDGMGFVDIDDMVVDREGMSIPELFEKKGEDYFRKVETECLEKACIKKGLVIATGGGIVKRKVNYNIMKQNGVVIWIKRDLDKLETDGRPLSISTPVTELYEERKDAYESWSDFFIDNNQEL